MRAALAALLLLPGGALAAAPALPAGVLPGTVYGAAGSVAEGSATQFCVLNPSSSLTAANHAPLPAGPAATMLRQGAAGLLVGFPGLEVGMVSAASANITPKFYAIGSATLNFTDAQDGTLSFTNNGVTFGPAGAASFSGYSISQDSSTGIYTVFFVISVLGCTLPFQASYLS